jgi:hypothetical protein
MRGEGVCLERKKIVRSRSVVAVLEFTGLVLLLAFRHAGTEDLARTVNLTVFNVPSGC